MKRNLPIVDRQVAVPHGVMLVSKTDLAGIILDEVEVAVVPGEAFGPSGYLRLSYALGDDQLLEGVQRLQQLFG